MKKTHIAIAALLCAILFASCVGGPAAGQWTAPGPLPQGREATTNGGFRVSGPVQG